MNQIIHTNLFSQQANDIISAAFGQLSDGWGENSPSLNKWWRFASVKRDVTGEVIVEISTDANVVDYGYYGNGRSRYVDNAWLKFKTEAEHKAQIATWIKKTIYMEIKDDRDQSLGVKAKEWRRDNTDFHSCYLNSSDVITIQDIYIVVEMLLGKFKESNYTAEAIARVVGTIRSEEETSAAADISNKLQILLRNYNTNRKTVEDELKALKAKLDEEYKAKLELLRIAYSTEYAELKKND